MPSKTSILWVLLSAIAVQIGLSLIILSHLPNSYRLEIEEPIALASDSSSEQVETTATLIDQEPSLPVRLIVPKLNIDNPIDYVGLNADGEMDVGKNPASLGWYSLGSRPGAIGSAVMAGHSGWRDNIPALFDHLDQLSAGDEIKVELEDGQILTFIVRESRHYDPQADAAEVFISTDGLKHLNLITCKGIWDKTAKSYSQRLVVFADQVD